MKFVRAAICVVLLLAAVAVAFGLASSREAPPKSEPSEQRMLVEVLTLEPTDARFLLASQGTVEPRIRTALSAEVAGPVVSISDQFVAGGVFSRGETLVTIDPTNYQAAVAEARATLTQREIEFAGVERLGEKGYRSETELAGAQAQLERAKAALVRAERDLQKTRVRLPYSGLVREKSVDIGQFVGIGAALGVVFATDTAEVRLPLTESDLRFLELPDSGVSGSGALEIELTGQYRGMTHVWPARVVRSEGIIDSATRVTFVVAQINDPYAFRDTSEHAPLPMGTFVTARIPGRLQTGVAQIPRGSLRGGDQVVLLDEENRVRIDSVNVIHTDDQSAWVEFESLAYTTLVTTAMEAPVNGQEVRVAGAKPVDAVRQPQE